MFIKKIAQIPAQYTDEDPFDIDAVHGLVNDLKTDWYMENPERQTQAIGNAFRAALTSPQQDLKWNSIVYQDLGDIPHQITDPDVYENHIRQKKQQWDNFGQTALDSLGSVAPADQTPYLPHMIQKYQPGIWRNIRNAGYAGSYLDELRQIALEDVSRGADGNYFRHQVLGLNIPGVGPKIASFAWLLLNPDQSKLSTLDVHMMRALKQDKESPANLGDYNRIEAELQRYKDSLGPKYKDVPLGMFQWAVWDKQRTQGFHQDHSGLRPLDPTPWHTIDWAPNQRTRFPQPPVQPENQLSLSKKISLSWLPF
jgi:hypothetical protein